MSFEVTNKGKLAGEEVAHLYVSDKISSVTTPVKLLKRFECFLLQAGETKKLSFELTPEDLSLWNREMKRVVEPGDFEVLVGGNSVEGLEGTFKVESLIQLKN